MLTKINRSKFSIIFGILLIFSESKLFAETTREDKSEISPSIQNSQWMNPDYNYVKITTDSDAPASIPIDNILKIMPVWKGKESKFFHIYHNNSEVYYYLNDYDGFIDNSDTLYFLGTRAFADTTFFYNFTNEEPFFLTHFTESEGLHYALINNNNNVPFSISDIFLDLHIEKDIVRSYGKQLYDSYNSDNEGWYWKEILPIESQTNLNTFTTYLNIESIGNDPIELKIHFRSVVDTILLGTGSNKYPEYKLVLFINNDSVDVKEFTRLKTDSFVVRYSPEKLINGINTFAIKTYEVHKYRPGVVSIDFITCKYHSKPKINKWINSFTLSKIAQPSRIQVEGFENPNVISIDSSNKTIQFPESSESDFKINVSIKKDKPYFGVYWNDTSYYNFNSGMHLIIISSKTKKMHSYIFQSYYEQPFYKMIQDAAEDDLIVLGYNHPNIVQKEFLYALDGLGYDKVKNMKSGENWVFVFSKKQVFFEELISDNVFSFELPINLQIYKNFKSQLFVEASEKHTIFVASKDNFSKTKYYKVAKPYLKDENNSAEVLVIYHEEFKDIAEEYVKLRKSTHNLKLTTVEVNDIYNEFNFGKKSSYPIKEFIKFVYDNWSDSLQSITFIGNASWDHKQASEIGISKDYIPSFGFPPSDYWYTILDNDFKPDISLGRISIDNNEDGWNYLDKLKAYESIPDQPWMKNFLFLSGGDSPSQRRNFANLKGTFFDEMILNEPLCGLSDSVSKYDEAVGGVSESGTIREKINNGALWVNFIGHANQNVFDMDGWQSYKLNNFGKYSFFSTISCNTGAFADPGLPNVRNEDYVFAKDKGFIGSIGSSTYGWVDENRKIIERIVQQISDSTSKLTNIGDLFNYGKNGLANEGAQLQTKHHSALVGDPLLRLRISRKPNLYIYPPEFKITNANGIPEVNLRDSIAKILIPIYNNGFKTNSTISIKLIDIYSDNSDTLIIEIPEVCTKFVIDTSIDISKKAGEHILKIILDPENKIPELKPDNKIFEKNFYVYSSTLLPLEPLSMWNVNLHDPKFKVINPSHIDGIKYHFSVFSIDSTFYYESRENEININENCIEWLPNFKLNEGLYRFTAYYVDNNNLRSNNLEIVFDCMDKIIEEGVTIIQNDEIEFNYNELHDLYYNDTLNSINISNQMKNIKLVSIGGNENTKRWANIEIDNDVYVDSEFYRGFNILTIPIYADNKEGKYKRFDTWVDGDDWINDSTASNLVEYLRDSIPDDNYLMIVTSSNAWKTLALHKLYNTNSSGSLDSLRLILKSFGSKLIDSVQGPMRYDSIAWYPWPHSFAMVGRKGMKPGEALENMNPKGDSATIQTNFEFLRYKGEMVTIPFGPSVFWKNISIKSNSKEDTTDFKINYELHGKNLSITNLISSGPLKSNNHEIFFEDSLRKKYKEILLKLIFLNKTFRENPQLYSINFEFQPNPELAIIRSQSIIDDSLRGRGEKTLLHVSLENLSSRSDANDVYIQVDNYSNTGISEILKKHVEVIQKNSGIIEDYTIENENLSLINNFNISVNKSFIDKELYSYNNKFEIPYYVYEDDIKPNVNVTFDGKFIQNGDYVTQKPLIEINVSDNSPFSFKDTNKIEVFINGAYITPKNVDYYNFYSYNNSTNLKCRLQIIPSKLEFGDGKINPANNIRVIAKDFYGNSDTLLYRVNVSKNNFLEESQLYPNPANNVITFKYNFSSRNHSAKTHLKLFNLTGQLVKSELWYSIFGENEHKIDLYNHNGELLSIGIYFYEIQIESDIWTEPIRGFFNITR